MLKNAFNSLISLHSRVVQIRRPGTIDIYSPCRVAPSKYFRYKESVENTVVHGREFIIPIDSLMGQFAQIVSFGVVPATGIFNIRYNGNDTTDLDETSTAASLQTALRLLAGLELVTVTGDFTTGFKVVFQGFSIKPLALSVVNNTLEDADTDPVSTSITQSYAPWTPVVLKRGDKIIDSFYGSLTVTEIDEMVDLGGAIMAFRIRAE